MLGELQVNEAAIVAILVALIGAIPATIAAVKSTKSEKQTKTVNGNSIGRLVERIDGRGALNSLRLDEIEMSLSRVEKSASIQNKMLIAHLADGSSHRKGEADESDVRVRHDPDEELPGEGGGVT